MARYIDADEINMSDISPVDGFSVYGATAEDIALTPTADVQPVKHGHWVNCKASFYHSFGECSECGHFTTMKHNYCPNCGCHMVEPQEK